MAEKKYATDYVEVVDRLAWFFEKYPEGTLQSRIVSHTPELVVVKAYAYRTPDDARPGTGLAAEPIPGKTPFTRDSEVQNAETSAWGRALAAIGSPTHGSIASADEVRNRQEPSGPAPTIAPKDCEHSEIHRVQSTPTGRMLPKGKWYCEACGSVIEVAEDAAETLL